MRVYLDHNATTPPHPDVLAAMAAADREAWANPSSTHGDGRAARRCLDDAREHVARLLGAADRDVVLTGSGTEANNVALRTPFAAGRRPGALVTSRLEHPSVVATAEALEAEGVEVRWLPVPPDGKLDPADLAKAIARGPVALVALHAVHHETGVVQDVPALVSEARRAGALVHVDLVQAAGRRSIEGIAFDTASLAAHKLRGPKGIGALVTRPGAPVRPVLLGGAQERGLRPGTQSPALAAGFGVAARLALSGPGRWEALRPLRDRLLARLVAQGAHATTTAETAAHVAHVWFDDRRGDEVVAALDLEGVSASAGPACAAGTAEPSPAAVAILGKARAKGAVRLSLGETTTEADIRFAEAALETVLSRPSRAT